MDTIAEQIVVREKSSLEKLSKILVFIAAVFLIVVLVIITLFNIFGVFSFFAGLLTLGVGYGTFYMITGMNIEYEYSVTNGLIDIDKIVGQRKRSRIIDVDCKEIDSFGKYSADNIPTKQYAEKIVVGNMNAETLYYFSFRHKEKGNVLVLFQPNEKVLNAIKRFLPRQVYLDAFGRN